MDPKREAYADASGGQTAAHLQETPLLTAVDKVPDDACKSGTGKHGLLDDSFSGLATTYTLQNSTQYSNPGYGAQCRTDAFVRSQVSEDTGAGVDYTTAEYQQTQNPIHGFQHPPAIVVQQRENCMNFYWLLYIVGWVFCFPPIWVGGAFGISSKKENERIAGWVSLVTCIIITITVIIPAIIVIAIATNSPFDDDDFE